MSAAGRDAQCISRRVICAGHCRFGHQRSSPVPRTSSSVLQDGQCVGGSMTFSLPSRSSGIERPAKGMTSPRRTTAIVSPMRRSRSRIRRGLCKVMFSTVTPPTKTGLTFARGAIRPTLPTCHSTSSSLVSFSSGGYLKAIAPRGSALLKPAASNAAGSCRRITAPSMS